MRSVVLSAVLSVGVLTLSPALTGSSAQACPWGGGSAYLSSYYSPGYSWSGSPYYASGGYYSGPSYYRSAYYSPSYYSSSYTPSYYSSYYTPGYSSYYRPSYYTSPGLSFSIGIGRSYWPGYSWGGSRYYGGYSYPGFRWRSGYRGFSGSGFNWGW